MNRQELFDRAVAGLASQGFERSYDAEFKTEGSTGYCMYRGPGGVRCAFGWLVPDELYSPKMEGKCASFVVNDHTKVRKLLAATTDDDKVFLDDLQSCHDNGHSPEVMMKHLRYFAKTEGLDLLPELQATDS